MADREKKTVVTKKFLAREERERIQRRIITITTIAIAVTVVALIVVGFIIEGVIKPSQPIAQIDDTEITTKQFQTWVRYQRYNLVRQYQNLYQMKFSFGDPESASYIDSYLFQIDAQLRTESIGLSAIETLTEDVFIRREAEKRGIEVSRDEVETRIEEQIFFYFKEGTPTPIPTQVSIPTSTYSPMQLTLVAPTPTNVITETEGISETEVSEPTPTVEATAVELVGEDAEPTASLPTSTPYTEDAFKDTYDDNLDFLKSYARVSEDDLFWIIESQLLAEKVMEAVTADLPTEDDKVWARHILFRDEETGEELAEGFHNRLLAGEDFIELAAEFTSGNEDDSNPSTNIVFEDLGWFGRDRMISTFEEVAYSLEIGEISEPVNTSFGWHVIQVLGHETQPLTDQEMQQAQQKFFEEWLAARRAEATVDINPDWLETVPLEPDIPEELRLSTAQ